jgi:hypothetical protein
MINMAICHLYPTSKLRDEMLDISTFLSMDKDMTLHSRKSAPIYTQDHITEEAAENTWYEQEQEKGTNK